MVDTDSRIVIACFKERDGDRGAYVVYLNDSQNTGVEGVGIPVPAGVSSYRHVTVHVPEIPNPEDVPEHAGMGQGTYRIADFPQGEICQRGMGRSKQAIPPRPPHVLHQGPRLLSGESRRG